MTQQQVYEEALKPSKKWVEAGNGDIGKVFIEILACNDLPNMDLGVGDFTDPFVGLVLEDNMVRTDVIHDALDPRWMPWCTRAFCFNVHHPSSILMLGVFDYDAATTHDPIGRVVVNMANFQSDTSYLLHYALHDDPKQDDVRMDWND
jgi:Ca2+-dependent lipid-binding protein